MTNTIRTENRIWGLVAYALTPVGALLALLVAGDDEGLRRHARQSVLAGIIVAALSLVLSRIPGHRLSVRPAGARLLGLHALQQHPGVPRPGRGPAADQRTVGAIRREAE